MTGDNVLRFGIPKYHVVEESVLDQKLARIQLASVRNIVAMHTLISI